MLETSAGKRISASVFITLGIIIMQVYGYE